MCACRYEQGLMQSLVARNDLPLMGYFKIFRSLSFALFIPHDLLAVIKFPLLHV